MFKMDVNVGWHVGAALRRQGPGLILYSCYFLCGVLHVSPRALGVLVGFFRVLWFAPTFQKHASVWIGEAKLPLGVNNCECACV